MSSPARQRGLEVLASLSERGPEALSGLSEAEARLFVERLHTSWIAGRIPPACVSAQDVTDADRRIGRLMQALPAPSNFEGPARSEAKVRRWCWAPQWYLMSQDEDLLLMDDAYMRPLLEECAAGCMKREVVSSIVAHHARDSAHALLWDGANGFEKRLSEIGGWASLAMGTGEESLAAYLGRLGGYACRRRVDEGEMAQRTRDLRRCHGDDKRRPVVRRRGGKWFARLDRANVRPGQLVVEVDTGTMWGEEIG